MPTKTMTDIWNAIIEVSAELYRMNALTSMHELHEMHMTKYTKEEEEYLVEIAAGPFQQIENDCEDMT